ncbi:hypothetical protein BKA62DRAFT_674033 [Auriculariales sp. MPI-PUGE-AT-0066]|nr:hypothetical protein BKA62DRAFT_674033 [Auriculariales sp. MPI-PUGE-AT-0066]
MAAHLLTLFRAQFSHTAQRCTLHFLSVAGTRRGMAYGHGNSSSKKFERRDGVAFRGTPESAAIRATAFIVRIERQRRRGSEPAAVRGLGDRGSRTSRYNDDGFRRDSDDSQNLITGNNELPPVMVSSVGQPVTVLRVGQPVTVTSVGRLETALNAILTARGMATIGDPIRQSRSPRNECSQPKNASAVEKLPDPDFLEGHMANDCTEPDTRVCHLCNTAGHISFNCPDQRDIVHDIAHLPRAPPCVTIVRRKAISHATVPTVEVSIWTSHRQQ